MVVLILGLPLALFLAWDYELTPEGIVREADVDRSQSITQPTGRKLDFAIIGALLLALGYFIWERQTGVELVSPSEVAVTDKQVAAPGPNRRSIAVLPFVK